MKKFAFRVFILLQIVLSGCSKDAPPLGVYDVVFHYENVDFTRYQVVEITESSKNELIIDGLGTFRKDGKKIENNSGSLKGEWSHPFNDDRYYIKGAFIEHVYTHGGDWFNYGTFEIKSR